MRFVFGNERNNCRCSNVKGFPNGEAALISDKGAVSIYMALFLASVLILFNVLNVLVEYRLFQIRVQAATISQSEQILASFDRKLLERYGLFAYDSNLINTEVFYKEVNCSRKNMEPRIEVKEDKYLFELEEFHRQIMLFSRPRVPINSATFIWDRIKTLLAGKENSNLPVPSVTNPPSPFTSYYDGNFYKSAENDSDIYLSDTRIYATDKDKYSLPNKYFQEFNGPFSGKLRGTGYFSFLSENNSIECLKEKYIPIKSKSKIPTLEEIGNIAEIGILNQKINHNSTECVAVDIKDSSLELLDYLKRSKDFYANRDRLNEDINRENGDSDDNSVENNENTAVVDSNINKVNTALQDFFVKEDFNKQLSSSILDDIDTSSPEMVIGEAAKLFDILNQSSIPVYDSWCLNEYIINQCSSAVRNSSKSLVDTSLNDNFTLRGDSFTSLNFKSAYETEEIITGLEGQKANLLVKFYIYLLRFLVRGIEVKNDRLKMAAYNTVAGIISLVSSLSSVPIPREAVVASLVFINSSTLALKDVISLSRGQCIKLIASKNYKIDYIDHLRIFLIFVPDEVKLSRLGDKVKSNTSDNLYTAVNLTSNWASAFGAKNYTISNEYRFNLSEGGN